MFLSLEVVVEILATVFAFYFGDPGYLVRVSLWSAVLGFIYLEQILSRFSSFDPPEAPGLERLSPRAPVLTGL